MSNHEDEDMERFFRFHPEEPPPTKPEDSIGILKAILRELKDHRYLFSEIRNYVSNKPPPPFTEWFELTGETSVATPNPATISNTLPNQGQDPGQITDGINPGYDRIPVWERIGRNALRLWIVNDGPAESGGFPGNLFVRHSTKGTEKFSEEFIIQFGETRLLSDVYELRVRSLFAGVRFRVTEREIIPPYVTEITNTLQATAASNRGNFTAGNIDVGLVDQQLPNITIPDGFAIVIRAHPDNLGFIYVSRTDATVAGSRISLAAGESTELYITNSNLMHVAASLAANGAGNPNTIDIITEL